MDKKRGQIGTEYLIVISFVTFVILSVLGIALLYSSQIKDSIKFNQIEKFSGKVISSAESVFYSGEPARVTITGYLPEGVTGVQIEGKDIVFSISTSSGTSSIGYSSKVELKGNIPASSGIKKLLIVANQTWVE